MTIKVGEIYDLVGYKGKKTPVQIVSESNDIYTIKYLDNSGNPAGTCRAGELVTRDQKITKAKTEDVVVVKSEPTPEPEEAEEESETEN